MRLKQQITLLALILCVMPAAVRSQVPSPAREFVKGEVVIELKSGASINDVNARIGTSTVQQIYGTNFYRLRTPNGKKENKFRKRLSKDQDVLSASLNPVVASISVFGRSTFSFPDGFAAPGHSAGDYFSQTELNEILKLNDVRLRSTGRGVIVAIIDTGVSNTHTLLGSRLWRDQRVGAEIEGADNDNDGLIGDTRGWDFVDNDNDPSEVADRPDTTVAGHGTFIAGLIALVAPDATIMPIRAFPKDGIGEAFTIASAVKYAADHGANVINLSLGSPEIPELLRDAITYARERGAVIVAAAGNENAESPPQYPSNSPDVLGVAAIDYISRKAPFSNFGAHIDITAPGVGLISAYPGATPGEVSSGYAVWSGTSFAAPLAAAEAALLLEVDPKNPDVKKAIEDSAFNIDGLNPGLSGKIGKGRINPLKALLNSLSAVTLTRDFHKEIGLIPGPGIVEARGKAEVSILDSTQEFHLEATRLSVRTDYHLIVNGIDLGQRGQISATALGDLRIEFSTEPGKPQLPAPLNPVTGIRRVELRDLQGRVWLKGDFSATDAVPVTRKEARLVSTGALADAAGVARAIVESGREFLKVEAQGLTPGALYRTVVDSVTFNSVADRSGFFRLELVSDGSGDRFLPPSLRPVTNIRRVEVRDVSGRVVLQGEFRPIATEARPSSGISGEIRKDVHNIAYQPDAAGSVRVRILGRRDRSDIEPYAREGTAQHTMQIASISPGICTTRSLVALDLIWRRVSETAELLPGCKLCNVRNICVPRTRYLPRLVGMSADLPI